MEIKDDEIVWSTASLKKMGPKSRLSIPLFLTEKLKNLQKGSSVKYWMFRRLDTQYMLVKFDECETKKEDEQK